MTGWEGEMKPARKRGRKHKAESAPADDDPRPVITISQGQMAEAIDQAEAALIAAKRCEVHQRGPVLVHVTTRPARQCDGKEVPVFDIARAQTAAVQEAFARAARFVKFDGRAQEDRPVDPPAKMAEMYMARREWKVPVLRQLVASPTMRTDGTLLTRPGYDERTGLYLTRDLPGLKVPDRPTHRQAEAANETLTEMLGSFPFVADPPGLALSVALSALMTAVLRSTVPASPLIGVSAPAAGTGKSYLCDLAAIIGTGQRAVAIATGVTAEEFTKSLSAALLDGRPMLVLDNMNQALAGQLLAIALTQETVAVRLLGVSQNVEIPNATMMMATGNNLRVAGDLVRRVLLCRLDAGVEAPEARAFDGDLLAEARRRRHELVSAILTIARWHRLRRDPAPQARSLAGFQAWCETVRDPLLALGHRDAVDALQEARATDIDLARVSALMERWWQAFADAPRTCGEAIRHAQEIDLDLAEAIAMVTGDRSGSISARKFSHYIARHERQIVAGRRFERDGERNKMVCWALKEGFQ